MPNGPFQFLYPPLRNLQEYLRRELARNPFLDLSERDLKPREGEPPEDSDDPLDGPPPDTGPSPPPHRSA